MIYSYYSCSVIIIIIIIIIIKKKKNNNNNNNNATSFRSMLSPEGRSRRDGRIPCIALLDPNVSPWIRLYMSRSESAMITLTGLDYLSFHLLSVDFAVFYNRYTPYSQNGKIVLKCQNGHYH